MEFRRMKHFKRFFIIWLIGMLSANVPWMLYGMLFGFIPVTLAAGVITILWDEIAKLN